MLHCKIDLVASNDASIDLHDASENLGAFYGLLESVDPRLAKSMHDVTSVKPWSFSLIKMECINKTGEPCKHLVKKGSTGFWIVNTTSPAIRDTIAAACNRGTTIHLGNLELRIVKGKVEDHSIDLYPENGVDTVTVHFHSPVLLADRQSKTMLPFTSRNYLDFQLRKMKDLGVINGYSIDDLDPFIRVLRDDTSDKWLHINLGGKQVSMHGHVGRVTFKISGDDEVKMVLWDLLVLSKYTGTGVRTSSGFGHCSISSWT